MKLSLDIAKEREYFLVCVLFDCGYLYFENKLRVPYPKKLLPWVFLVLTAIGVVSKAPPVSPSPQPYHLEESRAISTGWEVNRL